MYSFSSNPPLRYAQVNAVSGLKLYLSPTTLSPDELAARSLFLTDKDSRGPLVTSESALASKYGSPDGDNALRVG